MKNFLSIIVFLLSSLLCSCSEENDITGTTYSKTFITGYLTPETISTENTDFGIKLTFKGGVITSGKNFEVVSQYYNDVTYNRNVIYGPRIAINDSIHLMTVNTIGDFDALHLAGSDITDLVECQYISYYDYIHNNYKIVNSKNELIPGLNGYSEIEGAETKEMNLSDVCYYNTKLMAPDFMLKFKKTPDKKGEYLFNLTIILNGKELTKKIKFVFK